MSDRLTIDRALEMVEIMRRIMHRFCPYENADRYRLLEDLRAFETNLIRDKTSEYTAESK